MTASGVFARCVWAGTLLAGCGCAAGPEAPAPASPYTEFAHFIYPENLLPRGVDSAPVVVELSGETHDLGTVARPKVKISVPSRIDVPISPRVRASKLRVVVRVAGQVLECDADEPIPPDRHLVVQCRGESQPVRLLVQGWETLRH